MSYFVCGVNLGDPSRLVPSPPEGDKVLLEESLSYLLAALWASRVLWVVALLFPCSLACSDHSHSFLLDVVWRPRIALENNPPLLSSSSPTPLFLLYWIPPLYHLSLHPPPPLLRGLLGGIFFSLPAGFVDTQSVYGSLSPLPPLLFNSLPPHPSSLPLAFPEQ